MFSREPYPGLRSFRKDENDIFFGRDDHVAGMIDKLAATHFLCVTGSSGCGKSSLARTGLQNALEAGFLKGEGSDWIFCDFHPGNRPLGNLLDVLAGAIAGRAEIDDAKALAEREASLRQLVTDHIDRHSHNLNEVLSMISDSADRPVLLLVDQFEELFRYALDEPDEAVTFVDVLLATAAARKKVYVAITIRTDELDKCSRYPGLTDAVNAGQFLTPALDRFQIKEAIEGPVMLFGGTVEPALSTWLLNSLEREEDKLPLMQHALKFLYAQTAAAAAAGERIALTLAGMRTLFGEPAKDQLDSKIALRQFLSDRMDRFYRALPERLRRVTPALFCALTDVNSQGHDIRQAVRLHRLQKILAVPEADIVQIADVFREEGYLRPEPGTPLEPGTNIDVTHECVLRTWSSLRDWLVDEQRSRDHVREFVRDAYSYEADPGGHGAFPVLTGRDLLTGERYRRCNDWFTRTRPTAAWAERYLNPGDYTLPRIPGGKTVATDADSLFGYLVSFLNRSRTFREFRRWRTVGLIGLAAVIALGGTLAYLKNAENTRLNGFAEGITSLVQLLVNGDTVYLRIPSTPVSQLALGSDPAFTKQLRSKAEAASVGVDPVSLLDQGVCPQLKPAVNLLTIVDHSGTLYCDTFPADAAFRDSFSSALQPKFNAGALLTGAEQTASLGRKLIGDALAVQPGVPAAYRFLAWSFAGVSTADEAQSLAETSACLNRAISISCQNRQEITELAYGVEALSLVFAQYQLRFQQAILHGQLGHELLDPARQSVNLTEASRVELRRRGAEALAFSAHYLRLSTNCPSEAAATVCSVIPDWYDTAAKTFLQTLDGITTAPLHGNTTTELAYGGGMFGLFWGQDRAFREAARKYTSDDAVIAMLDRARAVRAAAFASLPRYNSVLAMAQCIAGQVDQAKATAERIDRTLPKYQQIYEQIMRCGESDREALFENPEISK